MELEDALGVALGVEFTCMAEPASPHSCCCCLDPSPGASLFASSSLPSLPLSSLSSSAALSSREATNALYHPATFSFPSSAPSRAFPFPFESPSSNNQSAPPMMFPDSSCLTRALTNFGARLRAPKVGSLRQASSRSSSRSRGRATGAGDGEREDEETACPVSRKKRSRCEGEYEERM
ncbi:hypothetical protein GLOTRDRAFT_111366 [Gloeophyllum trabeum ATCC 11539]|uniref:Uncharacterized protein n=1 Tax=Gloeophyllum trabeum (strain ATCC 11539 / FP-39264 / Madison 617) TaxID=670483 RepID=S7RJW3_GLOTA|nr:uncharacterized protein GLOTRDRAFT_111366 [Gloeophyllum trabeum ATCC 11539]EPQ54660.1 hypothetical protein GLOTRDRAFT_111366 [Gloeophyllum trabeum ATCC 11539]